MNFHEKTLNWYKLYLNRPEVKQSKKLSISTEMFDLIKFFISSDLSLNQLNNIYLRRILKDEIRMPSVYTFRYKYLNAIMIKLHAQIDFKCKSAEAITLIPDGWVDNLNTEYLGLGAQLTNDCFEKEVIVLGFIEVIGGHCAENIKAAIETIVNKYEFDKSKVKGKIYLKVNIRDNDFIKSFFKELLVMKGVI